MREAIDILIKLAMVGIITIGGILVFGLGYVIYKLISILFC